MFTERKFQTQIIQDELKGRSKTRQMKTKKKVIKEVIIMKAKAYLKLFLETSSIHGLNHLVAVRRHPIEKILWLIVVGLCVFGSVYLSQTTWIRYQSSPTVISMDRDMFAWNTTFPSVTVCQSKKLDEKKLETYVENSDEPDKEKLKAFIRALSNATYKTFQDVPDYKGIQPENFMELLLNLSAPFKPTLTIGVVGVTLNIIPTITEMGLCYAINTKSAIYNSPEYRAANRWDILKEYNNTLFVHPLDGEVFAQVINFTTAYDVYIHGPLEVPDISAKHEHSEIGFYMKLYVTAFTVYTAPDAARRRKNMRRQRIAMLGLLCRCTMGITVYINFVLVQQNDQTDDDVLYKLKDTTGKRIDCGCVPLCDDVNYILQSNSLQEWFLGTNLQWGLVTYPRMRYRRDIIFGFTDVLVAVGGMAGLFLGCSVLSFMEIVYFLTLRLICYAKPNRKYI